MKQYNVIDALLSYADTSLDFSREVSCFALPSCGIISVTSNDSMGSVEFDWFTIKNKIWKLKNDGNAPEIAYMLHTHPPSFNRMSSIDRNMVYGWCMALGIPIWFLVLTENEIATYLCSLNQETKKVERDLVDLSCHEDVCIDLRMITEIMYGLSKAPHRSNFGSFNEIFNRIFEEINSSRLGFNYIHEWNVARSWNQIAYMELS